MSSKWVPGTPGDLVNKRDLFACSGSATLPQLNPIHEKGTESFFFFLKKKDSLVSSPVVSENQPWWQGYY